MLKWIQDNQAIILIAWPLLTAVFSMGYKYADSVPRIHAALSILSALGIDLPKLWDAIGRLFTGNPPSGGGKLTELPGPMIKGVAPKPPQPPTAVRKETLVFPKRLMGALVGLFMLVAGCSWLQSPQGVATIKGGVDLAVCVLNHSSEPIPQIVTDCGASTAEDVVAILDAHHANDTKKLVSLAHAETADAILKVLDAHSAANIRESSAKGGGQ